MSYAATMRTSYPVAQSKVQSAPAKCRALLALDGHRLTPEVQMAALKRCVQLTSRLDILLVNPPKAPTFLLGGLLLRLEHSGVDYRLTSCEGELGNEIAHYLRRFQGIGLVIVDGLPSLEQFPGLNRLDLDRAGHRFISLSEPDWPPGGESGAHPPALAW